MFIFGKYAVLYPVLKFVTVDKHSPYYHWYVIKTLGISLTAKNKDRKCIPYVFARNIQLLQCPICINPFVITHAQLTCTNNHDFDFARTGYVNYHHKAVKTLYDKKLFKARNAMIENGFFDGLEQFIVKLLIDEFERKGHLTILDAGCGDDTLF